MTTAHPSPRQGLLPAGGSPRRWLVLALVGLLYFLAGRLGLSLTLVHASASPVWPPTGIALAALLVLGMRAWPAIFVGATLFNFANAARLGVALTDPAHVLVSIAIGAGNTLEAVAGAWLVRRYAGGHEAFTRPGWTILFFASALVAAAIAATVGVGALTAGGFASATEFGHIWSTWWLGDAAGAMLLAPPLLLWYRDARGLSRAAATAVAIIALVSLLVFVLPARTQTAAFAMILIPLLAWPALRLGPRESATAMLVVAAAAIVGTLAGRGPLALGTPNESLLLLQILLTAVSLAIMTVGAAIYAAPRERTMRPAATALAALMPLVLAALVLGALANQLTSSLQGTREAERAEELATSIEDTIQDSVRELTGLRGFFVGSEEVRRDEFAQYVGSTASLDAPGIEGVIFARRVPLADLETFERRTRADTSLDPAGNPGFRVHPEPLTDPLFVIDYLVPMEPNAPAVGLNLMFEENRRAAIERAVATGEPVVSGPLSLIQADPGHQGFLVVVAVVRTDELLGVVQTGHRYREAIDAAVAHAYAVDPPAIRLYDIGEAGTPTGTRETTLVYDTIGGPVGSGPSGRIAALDVPGRDWVLQLESVNLLSPAERAAPWLVLATGSLLSILLAGFVYANATVGERSRRIAHQLTSELRRSNEDLERFAYAASHDLKQPLRAITAYSQFLDDEKERLTPEGRSQLATIQRSAAWMNQMIDGLLEYSRLGGRAREEQEVDLDELVAELVRLEFPEHAEAIHAVDLGVMRGDPTQLQVVVRNLVSNALKFRRPDAPPRVEIRARRDRRGTILEVADNGIGIAPQDQAKVFELFRRLQPRGAYPGTGIGLALVKRIVDLHHGTIEVESEPGRGTTFRLYFPGSAGSPLAT